MQLSRLFAPLEREFFDLFEEAGANIVRAAGLLETMVQDWPDHGELARDVVVCEQEGDRITHAIVQRLNQAFVTPIDREDIYALASGLDDIVDWIEEVADFFAPYRIEAAGRTYSSGSRTRSTRPSAWRTSSRASRSRTPSGRSRSSRTGALVAHDFVLWIVVATALAFDFTNGFHERPTPSRPRSRRARCRRGWPSASRRS